MRGICGRVWDELRATMPIQEVLAVLSLIGIVAAITTGTTGVSAREPRPVGVTVYPNSLTVGPEHAACMPAEPLEQPGNTTLVVAVPGLQHCAVHGPNCQKYKSQPSLNFCSSTLMLSDVEQLFRRVNTLVSSAHIADLEQLFHRVEALEKCTGCSAYRHTESYDRWFVCAVSHPCGGSCEKWPDKSWTHRCGTARPGEWCKGHPCGGQ